jgi:ring-1,2-phenylacetyl-CoA epoxidase subunit PaaE
MSKFHSLKVKAIEKTTADCAVLTFDVDEKLIADFAYTQGQYLTMKADINGEEVRRSYSLCSSPLDNEWKVAVKKIEDGKFSTFANDVLKQGDTLEVMPPNGKFFVDCEPTKAKNYIAFAAGSGITPILSIIKTHLLTEPNSTFKLFYINQAVSTIILKEEVESLRNVFLGRFEIYHFLTREQRNVELFNGRLSKEKMEIICDKLVDVPTVNDAFICGPNEMIFMVRDFLQAKGMAEENVHFELFNTSGVVAKKKTRKVDKSKMSQIHIIEGGKTIQFSIPQGSDNILDAGLKQNMDLPFACKGGVCCTCRAMLVEGDIEMEVNYSLEPDEVEAGFILTCQAVPLSEKVVVNFDA